MRALVFAAFFTMLAAGADITGIWTGQVSGRFGEVEDLSFRFAGNGTSVTGKMYVENDSLPVRDAKLQGDEITFSISTEMNGGGRKFLYSGTVKGNEMQLTRRRELLPGEEDPQKNKAAPQPLTLKRLL